MEKYGFIYIWYDRKHKRYYVGSHWGHEDDGYVCSSTWMLQAYKHRPRDFKRRIIERYSDRQLSNELEHRWLQMMKPEELKNRYYNMNNYRFGHWSNKDYGRKTISEKISIRTKEAMADPEIRKKYEESYRRADRRSSDPEVRRKRSESMKKAMAEKFPNRKVRAKFGSEDYRQNMAEKSREMWQNREHREAVGAKISASLVGRPSPTKGTVWWNDGSKNVRRTESPGAGWSRGRV